MPAPEIVEMEVAGLAEPLRLPADALREITDAAMPAILEHGQVSLTIGAGHRPPQQPEGLIKGSGRRGDSRRLAHVVSVRFFADLLDRLAALAAEDGVSVSEWIRDAAADKAHRRDLPPVVPGYRTAGWQCAHMSLTSSPGTFGSVNAGCGCEMQPILVAA